MNIDIYIVKVLQIYNTQDISVSNGLCREYLFHRIFPQCEVTTSPNAFS
jgi:hypothetical protein